VIVVTPNAGGFSRRPSAKRRLCKRLGRGPVAATAQSFSRGWSSTRIQIVFYLPTTGRSSSRTKHHTGMQEPAPSPATSRELSVGSIVTTTCHNFPQELLVIQRMQSSRPHLICVALGHDEDDDLAGRNDSMCTRLTRNWWKPLRFPCVSVSTWIYIPLTQKSSRCSPCSLSIFSHASTCLPTGARCCAKGIRL